MNVTISLCTNISHETNTLWVFRALKPFISLGFVVILFTKTRVPLDILIQYDRRRRLTTTDGSKQDNIDSNSSKHEFNSIHWLLANRLSATADEHTAIGKQQIDAYEIRMTMLLTREPSCFTADLCKLTNTVSWRELAPDRKTPLTISSYAANATRSFRANAGAWL